MILISIKRQAQLFLFMSMAFCATKIVAQTNIYPAAGNVGVGTTSPATKLTVVGTADAVTITDNTNVQTITGYPLPNIVKIINTESNAIPTLVHATNNKTSSRSQFIVSSSGNGAWERNFMTIGVHGTTFSYNGGSDYYLTDGTSDAGLAMINAQGEDITKLSIGTYLARPVSFYTGNVQRLNITATGEVGIGTTNPATKLEVGGSNPELRINPSISAFNQKSTISFYGTQPSSDFATYETGKIVSGFDANSLGNNYLNFITKNSTGTDVTAMTIKNGNVGIGTLNPTSLLSVKGQILAQKVRVSIASADWPDYVFDQTYTLPPLRNVEEFIQKHKHLPEIPTATEVDKNGIDLATNQALLLKKIEELTIYLIDLSKKVDSLTDENKLLKNQRTN